MNIGYSQGMGPDGSYLFAKDEKGIVIPDPQSDLKKFTGLKIQDIVPALEKAYPDLAGRAAAIEVDVEVEKLAAAGKVHVLGQVENSGDQPAACIASAKATPFGALSRVQVIRKQKHHTYDLKKKENADIKLEPGDVVLVPMKKVIGL
ncbi:MAG: hypothetical protein EOP83_17235 [Verrucomicrobiaceae bacterium]|nr:MAG: hypothetical protein EOP83_17235 [Verrucomicrobiaceae bacterium]